MAWPLKEVKQLACSDYSIAWICALPLEKVAARNMLDELHKTPPLPDIDSNIYTCGRIHDHNIVIVCQSDMGSVAAAVVANQLVNTFQRLRCGLLVGIAGGVPDNRDIRLGDVVISRPDGRSGGVVAHDRGRWTLAGFESTPYLNGVPQRLQNVFNELESLLMDHENRIMDYIQAATSRNPLFEQFARPEQEDYLFVKGYGHLQRDEGAAPCALCSENKSMLVSRPPRGGSFPTVHFGGVASGNQLVNDGLVRSQIAERHPGVFALEMEAAGLMNVFGCATIRGICDYADSHKNNCWQNYAAAVAAAVTKEILRIIPGTAKRSKPDASNALSVSGSELSHAAVPRAFIGRDELRWIEQVFTPNSSTQ
ncbi:nucleoside phosphorylase domain-containing protein [Aspergillus granulosus]|uniref:Nucleoside phosphorylase domain-containing protein n=1 Tax=Aspergillus granulosus TaxID=176169 RepID=A0ABR4HBD2_9EURO